MSTATYVLRQKIKVNKEEEKEIIKNIKVANQIYNYCLNYGLKLLNRIKYDKRYIKAKNEYKFIAKSKVIDKSKKPSLLKSQTKIMNEVVREYGFTEYNFHNKAKPLLHYFNRLGSFEIQVVATKAFRALEKLLYKKAKKVKFKPYYELSSIENKSNKTGLRLKDDFIIWGKLKLKVKFKDNEYVRKSFFDKVKYIRIVPKQRKNKINFYVDIVKEGIPPLVKIKDNNKDLGIDIGTSSIAYVSDDNVKLISLKDDYIDKLNRKIKLIDKKQSRRRLLNEDNFRSKKYIKDKNKRIHLYHKLKVYRKEKYEKISNNILKEGTDVKVETMSFKGLAKKSKETTINEKNGKTNKKKRFGKSINNYAPASLLEIINRKLTYIGKELIKINTQKVKASQYNHKDDCYEKHKLSERTKVIDGKIVQRDMYSAFLIKNVINLEEIDRQKCLEDFEQFYINQNIELDNLSREDKVKLRGII